MNSLTRLLLAGLIASSLISIKDAKGQEDLNVAITEDKGVHISFDFKQADLKNVLRLFSAKANINIIAGPDVTGTITMRLQDVPWEKALELILEVNGYGFQRDGNIIKVLTRSELSKQPTQTQVFFLNYAEAAKLEKSVSQLLSKEGTVRMDDRSNTLIVTDLPQNLLKIAPVIQTLDQQTPQVLVQSMVIETNAVANEDIGINWAFLDNYGVGIQGISNTLTQTRNNTKTYSDTRSSTRNNVGTIANTTAYTSTSTAPNLNSFNLSNLDTLTQNFSDTDLFTRIRNNSNIKTATLTADNLEIFLSFLESTTDAKVLSAPEVLTTNNQTARILVGEQYPLANYVFNDDTGTLEVQGFTYIDIGIKLHVTPKISPDGYVTLDVKPEIKVRGANVPFAGSTGTVVPIINTQEAEVQAVVKDGETLVIGGLITDNTTEEKIKVPLLGDLPIIGPRLFTDTSVVKTRRNLFIFVTPTIISSKNVKAEVDKRRKIVDAHNDGIPEKEKSFWSNKDKKGKERELNLNLDSVYAK